MSFIHLRNGGFIVRFATMTKTITVIYQTKHGLIIIVDRYIFCIYNAFRSFYIYINIYSF
jgi:hypothetical protein